MKDNNNLPPDCQSEGGDMGTIYKITCLISKKSYVGKTTKDLDIRINQHKRDSKRAKTGVDAAIRKYGWDNFTVEVLETCPVEKLNEREIFQIREQNTKAPNGYNLTDGGDGGRGLSPSAETRAKLSAALKGRPAHNKGVSPSDATRAKMSATKKAMGFKPPSAKGRRHSKESLAKMSAAQSGKNNGFYGKHHSQKTRAQMSVTRKGKTSPQKGKTLSPETRKKISVALKAYWARKKAIENGGNS